MPDEIVPTDADRAEAKKVNLGVCLCNMLGGGICLDHQNVALAIAKARHDEMSRNATDDDRAEVRRVWMLCSSLRDPIPAAAEEMLAGMLARARRDAQQVGFEAGLNRSKDTDDYILELEATKVCLEGKLAACRQDTARLDWLQDRKTNTDGWYVQLGGNADVTVREALDAAMKTEEP